MTVLEAAKAFGVNPRWAVVTRLTYLGPRIAELNKKIRNLDRRLGQLAGKRNIHSAWRRLCAEREREAWLRELHPLRTEFHQLQRYLRGEPEPVDTITPERLEEARNYPIERLLGQTPRGAGRVVRCPFHEDKHPSASVKYNLLICFSGCRPQNGAKGWDPIALLMERDGLSFPEAVRQLT